MQVAIVVDQLGSAAKQAITNAIANQQRVYSRLFDNLWVVSDDTCSADEWLNLVTNAVGPIGAATQILVVQGEHWAAHAPGPVLEFLTQAWGQGRTSDLNPTAGVISPFGDYDEGDPEAGSGNGVVNTDS